MLCTDDLVLIEETMAEQQRINAWKRTFVSKGLKVNIVKTLVVVSNNGQISIKPFSMKDPCGICVRTRMAYAVLC